MSNDLNYVQYDFDDLVVQLINRIRQEDAWKDTYRSATGQMLVELLAYVANLVLYYIERRAEESYISTAKNRSSVVNLVKLLNYNPKRNVSSTGVLKFSVPTAPGKNIFVSKWTECQTSNGYKFLVSQDAVISGFQTEVEVDGIQGEIVEINTTSTGDADQEFTISDTKVENTNLFIYVDDVEWDEVSSFIASTATSLDYRVNYNLDGTVTIIFGNDIFGKIPPTGSEILIRYVKSDGLDGNVYEPDKITTINTPIYDEDGALVDDIEVTNPEEGDKGLFLGGDDEEDIEEIRYEAPRVFSTGERAVTKLDFKYILENTASVANANVWGENEENPPNYDMFNRVKIVLILQEWVLPNDEFKDNLTEALYEKSLITVKYEYVDPIILQVIPVIDVKANQGETLSQVQAEVETAFDNAFELGVTTKLGVDKRISDLVALIDNLDSVSYHHLYLDIRKEMQMNYDSFYEYGETLDATPVLRESAKVYLNGEEVAVDDGAGGFTTTASGMSVVGTINYTTGYTVFDISPADSSDDELVIRYQQDANGDIEVGNQSICQLYDVDVTSISYDTDTTI